LGIHGQVNLSLIPRVGEPERTAILTNIRLTSVGRLRILPR